jgi:hypothetical protein
VSAEKDSLSYLDDLSGQILTHYGSSETASTPFTVPELPVSLKGASEDPLALLAADYTRVCAANAELAATARGLQQMNAELAIYAQRLLSQLAKYTTTAPAPPMPILKAAAAGTTALAATAAAAVDAGAVVRAPGHGAKGNKGKENDQKKATSSSSTSSSSSSSSAPTDGEGSAPGLPFIPAAFLPYLRAAPGSAYADDCAACREIKTLTALPIPAGPAPADATAAAAAAAGGVGVGAGVSAIVDDSLLAQSVLPGTFGAADVADATADAPAPARVAAAAARAARAWVQAEAAHTGAVRAAADAAAKPDAAADAAAAGLSVAGAPGPQQGDEHDEEESSGWGVTTLRIALWAVLMSAVAADVLLRERALKLEFFHT